MTKIEAKYREKCATPSDIFEHLPTLRRYAERCEHITELGVRAVVSTWAFLAGLGIGKSESRNPNRCLLSVDLAVPEAHGGNLAEVFDAVAEHNILAAGWREGAPGASSSREGALGAADGASAAAREARALPCSSREGALGAPPLIHFNFVTGDDRQMELEPTDLLFIDTWHVYEQLKTELALHAKQARKFIILHDTQTYGIVGESISGEPHRGLIPALHEFLQVNPAWRRVEHFTNCNGLTILERS